MILVPFWDEKLNSYSTETEVREDGRLTVARARVIDFPNTLDMGTLRDQDNSLKIRIYIFLYIYIYAIGF